MDNYPTTLNRSELARFVGVTRKTISAWEQAGLISPGRPVNGQRTEFDQPAVLAAMSLAAAR